MLYATAMIRATQHMSIHVSMAVMLGTLTACTWDATGEDAASELHSTAPTQPEADTAEVFAELTTPRIIPIRVVYTAPNWICFNCTHPAPLEYQTILKSVARANVNFQPAGIKFYIKSFEYIPTDELHHHNVGDPSPLHTWFTVTADAQKLFPAAQIPSSAYESTKSLKSFSWLKALTDVYGEPDMLHVFVAPGSGGGGATYPHEGRSVVVRNCNLLEDAEFVNANETAVTRIL